jgi:hypothetical protein
VGVVVVRGGEDGQVHIVLGPWARGRGYFDIETPNLDTQIRSHYIILSCIGPFQNVFHLCAARLGRDNIISNLATGTAQTGSLAARDNQLIHSWQKPGVLRLAKEKKTEIDL